MTSAPVPRIGVLALVPDRWNAVLMPRHQVLSRLARRFPVVWIEPELTWDQHWIRSPSRSTTHSERIPTGMTVLSPSRWTPRVYRPSMLSRFLTHQRLCRARNVLVGQGCNAIVIYVWRPDFLPSLDLVEHDAVVYHIDDEYSFSDHERPTDPMEEALIHTADHVIVHSRELLRKKGRFNPCTTFIPNGVDFVSYSAPRDEPEDMKRIPHPRIGYQGVMKRQLDLALLVALADARPDWSFVMIGPTGYLGEKTRSFDVLRKKSNVYLLGNRVPADLPAYVQHFDVGIMPYVVNDYTRFIYPLKLHEYFAAGIPAVGSPIAALMDFAADIAIAHDRQEWVTAIESLLGDDTYAPDQVARRRRIALDHDWDLLVDRIAGIIATVVHEDRTSSR